MATVRSEAQTGEAPARRGGSRFSKAAADAKPTLRKPDGAAVRLAFETRQDFKAAFLEYLTGGATVIEHPQRTDGGGLSTVLRDPEGHQWELTAPS